MYFDGFGAGGGRGHGGGFRPGGGLHPSFHGGIRTVRGGGFTWPSWGGWWPSWDGYYGWWPWWPYVSSLPSNVPLRAAFDAWQRAAAQAQATPGIPPAAEVERLRQAFVALLYSGGYGYGY